MIPTPVMDAVELEVVLLVVVSVVTLLLLRNFRLKREAFDEIDRFMEDNADLMRAGGDEFFERWVIASYLFNSFGVTRSHYARVVEDMKEFIVESAKEETSGLPPPFSQTSTPLRVQESHSSPASMERTYTLRRPHSVVSSG